MPLPVGSILLVVVGVLIYFGVAHRVLDRMRLSDRTALLFIGLILVGGFINIPLIGGPAPLTVNVGGAVVPLVLAIWLLATADTGAEKARGVIASLVAAGAVYAAAKLLPNEPTGALMEPSYVFALVAGLVAYLAGRSRRSAFVAATMATILGDIAGYAESALRGTGGQAWLGGAGAFDATIIAGLVAVAATEVLGEGLEFLQGGPRSRRGQDLERPRPDRRGGGAGGGGAAGPGAGGGGRG